MEYPAPPRTRTTDKVAVFVGTIIGKLLILATRALVVMFFAAVITKRFDVFAPIGYIESLAWAAGYGLVRGLFHKDEDEKG